jgi:hypothetical protein
MDLTKIPLPDAKHNTLLLGSQYGTCDFIPQPGKIVIISVADPDCPCTIRTSGHQLVARLPWSIKDGFVERFTRIRHLVYTVIDHAFKLNIPVLVHCKRGHRRSVIIVTSYLMQRYGWTPKQAVAHVKRARPSIKEQHVEPVLSTFT